MPPTTKTLSPAELAKLEHAFATDPASEAYKPLAEAYLGMGRFMEAMVVCKKGVKAHASDALPRVLLARVYAAQAKDKKALEELQGALQVAPNDVNALRLAGSLQLKNGETEPGRENVLKALSAAPNDEETLAVMQQFGIEAPKPAAPPPVAAPPMLQPVPAASQGIQLGSVADLGLDSGPLPMPRPSMGAKPAVAQPRRTTGQTAALARPAASGSRPAVARRPHRSEEVSEVSEVSELSRSSAKKKARSGPARAMFFLLLFTVPLAAGAYYGIGQWKAKQAREVKAKIQAAQDLIKNDTYDSYKKACDAAERALDVDPSSVLAHRYLAYAYTVRWGEHERNDDMRKRAEEHLVDGRAKPDNTEGRTYQYAAEALFKFYSGQGSQGLKDLDEQVKQAEAKNQRSSTLYLTLGLLQMNQGDLEKAKESLEKAQQAAADDPRVFVALGTLARRRGNDQQALTHYNAALRYSRNSHPEALLGTALLVLDQDNPASGYITAAKYVKTLLEADPPPSPRQLAQAHMVKALLVSRVSHDLPLFTKAEFQKELEAGTGIGADPTKAKSEISSNENDAFSRDRANPELFVIKAKRLFYEEKYDEAATEVRKAIEMNGSDAHFHVELARVLFKKEGGELMAEDALKKAVSLVPNSPKLLAMLGQAQYRAKKLEEAKVTLEKATQDSKTRNPDARLLLGRILRDEKKDYDRAAAMFDQAAKEYFSDSTLAATALDDLGVTWELKRENDKARIAYEKALNTDKDYPPAYCHYSRFLSKSPDAKERQKARDLAVESLKQDPQGPCATEMRSLTSG